MSPVRLLVVDDEELEPRPAGQTSPRQGYEVEVAASGAEALDALNRGAFNLVLLDIQMPEISGLDVLRTVRATRSATQLPIIMVTAKSAARGYRRGAGPRGERLRHQAG